MMTREEPTRAERRAALLDLLAVERFAGHCRDEGGPTVRLDTEREQSIRRHALDLALRRRERRGGAR